MEEYIYIITRAFAIGLLISAPMGPIGVLCIQRTLSKGRLAGFYTGIGAAISDLIYCLLTGLGLSFITDFVETNRNILQVIGSAVLLAYAIFLIKGKKKPKTSDTSAKHLGESVTDNPTVKQHTHLQDLLTGFFLTFSNPLIVFLIIGLFARFNFLLPEYHWHHYLLGYIFIVVGALSWWTLITRFVDTVRSKFSIDTMHKLNKMIGLIILIMSLVGIFTGLLDYLTLPQIGALL